MRGRALGTQGITAMQTEEPGARPEQNFPVAYGTLLSSRRNLDLRGRGELIVRPAGPTYVFVGKERGIRAGQRTELVFRPDEIWNVGVSGRSVRFNTQNGRSGVKNAPFTFQCRDAAEAAAIAALLPDRKSADFVEAEVFTARLAAVPGSDSPWGSVTNGIVAVNVIVFLLMAALLGAGWLAGGDLMVYVRWGANNGGATTDGQWWRLATSMFMHYGVIHLACNLWALFQVGHLVEKLVGRPGYALVYFGSGVTGSLASIIWHGDQAWNVGASGAVFGLYGALLGYMLREKHPLPRLVFQPLFMSTIVFAAYNLFNGLSHRGIDNAAHVGGILGGLAIGWAVAVPVDPVSRARLMPRRLGLGAAVAALLIAAGVAATPRFDYRLADEVAWVETSAGRAGTEARMLKRLGTALEDYRAKGQDQALLAVLEDEVIPFYQQWQKRLDALKLAPGRATARRRAALDRFWMMRIESYQRLAAAVRTDDPSAVDDFLKDDARASAEIDALSDQNGEH